jgi:type I restriction enzyme S subunit
MNNLKSKKLQDLAAPGRSVISGPFGSNIGKRFFQDKGIPIIRGNNLTTDFRKFNDEGFAFLTNEKADELKSDAIKGDVLFTAAGTIGQVGIIPKNAKYDRYVISNKQLRFRVDSVKADPEYVYYWLASPWIFKTILNHNTGSTVPLINLGIIKSLPISIPESVEDQKKIAKVFSLIDQKIELNNKINAELEAKAKLIYDYWFVQFDFPDANGKPYKSSGGKMVYSKDLKREIPEGWTQKYLSELSTRIGDGIHGTPKYVDESEYSFINGNNLKNGFIYVNSNTKKVDAREYDKYFINLGENSILLSINGTLGNLAVYTDEKVMLGKSSAYINCLDDHRPFCYQFLNQKHMKKVFWDIATGSTIKNLSLASLNNLKMPYPGTSLVEKFSRAVSPIDEKRANIFKENQKLIELRDWLLPMLMNGQVTVK